MLRGFLMPILRLVRKVGRAKPSHPTRSVPQKPRDKTQPQGGRKPNRGPKKTAPKSDDRDRGIGRNVDREA